MFLRLTENYDLNIHICNYINKEWIARWDGSIRSFAEEHDVDGKTIRQIAESKNTPYRIGLYTLHKICVARDLTLDSSLGLLRGRECLSYQPPLQLLVGLWHTCHAQTPTGETFFNQAGGAMPARPQMKHYANKQP